MAIDLNEITAERIQELAMGSDLNLSAYMYIENLKRIAKKYNTSFLKVVSVAEEKISDRFKEIREKKK